MAHRLASSVRKVDRILKSGLFTGNFNIFAQHLQAQPKSLESRRFISQSNVLLSNELKGFNSRKENNKGATSVGVKEAADENTEAKANNGSSTPPPNSEPKAPNQDIDAHLAKVTTSPGDFSGGVLSSEMIINIFGLLGVCFVYCDDFNWKDLVDNLMGRGTLDNGENGRDVKSKGLAALRDWIPLGLFVCVCFRIHKRGDKIGPKQLLLLRYCVAICSCWVTVVVLKKIGI